MSEQQTSPMAGVLRVLFFLAVAVVAVTVVVSGVTTLYEAPSGDGGFVFGGDQESADYNRNLGLIFGLIGTATVAVGLLGLGSRFNPLRAGLLAGGVGLVLAGVGVGSSGSDDWLVFLTSGLALIVLIGSAYWLDEGLPLKSLTGGTPRGGGDSGSGEGQALGGGEPGLDKSAEEASRDSRA